MKLCLTCNQYFRDAISSCPNDLAPLESVGKDPLIGALISERYMVESVIGKGTSGIVYKARRIQRGEMIVAVKVLHSYLDAGNDFLESFLREARAVSRLRNPHIINIWDWGVTDDGQPFWVMDFLLGVTLAQLLKEERLLPIGRSLSIIRQTCEALSEAHNQGIVHRDLKPENIILQETDYGDDYVKLLDFGIAKGHHNVGAKAGKDFPPASGKAIYMSPEQCQAVVLDTRSDIYSLALIAFELFAGETPFLIEDLTEDQSSIKDMHLHCAPRKLAQTRGDVQFPVKLEETIARALSKDPKQRQRNVKEFWNELESAIKGTEFGRLAARSEKKRQAGKSFTDLAETAIAIKDDSPSHKVNVQGSSFGLGGNSKDPNPVPSTVQNSYLQTDQLSSESLSSPNSRTIDDEKRIDFSPKGIAGQGKLTGDSKAGSLSSLLSALNQTSDKCGEISETESPNQPCEQNKTGKQPEPTSFSPEQKARSIVNKISSADVAGRKVLTKTWHDVMAPHQSSRNFLGQASTSYRQTENDQVKSRQRLQDNGKRLPSFSEPASDTISPNDQLAKNEETTLDKQSEKRVADRTESRQELVAKPTKTARLEVAQTKEPRHNFGNQGSNREGHRDPNGSRPNADARNDLESMPAAPANPNVQRLGNAMARVKSSQTLPYKNFPSKSEDRSLGGFPSIIGKSIASEQLESISPEPGERQVAEQREDAGLPLGELKVRENESPASISSGGRSFAEATTSLPLDQIAALEGFPPNQAEGQQAGEADNGAHPATNEVLPAHQTEILTPQAEALNEKVASHSPEIQTDTENKTPPTETNQMPPEEVADKTEVDVLSLPPAEFQGNKVNSTTEAQTEVGLNDSDNAAENQTRARALDATSSRERQAKILENSLFSNSIVNRDSVYKAQAEIMAAKENLDQKSQDKEIQGGGALESRTSVTRLLEAASKAVKDKVPRKNVAGQEDSSDKDQVAEGKAAINPVFDVSAKSAFENSALAKAADPRLAAQAQIDFPDHAASARARAEGASQEEPQSIKNSEDYEDADQQFNDHEAEQIAQLVEAKRLTSASKLADDQATENADQGEFHAFVKQKYQALLNRLPGTAIHQPPEALTVVPPGRISNLRHPRTRSMSAGLLVLVGLAGAASVYCGMTAYKFFSGALTTHNAEPVATHDKRPPEEIVRALEWRQRKGELTKQEIDELSSAYLALAQRSIKQKHYSEAIRLLEKKVSPHSSVYTEATKLDRKARRLMGKK